jgi:hypothetical protein
MRSHYNLLRIAFVAVLIAALLIPALLIPAAPPALAQETATIHYHRPDGEYDGWGLHVWGAAAQETRCGLNRWRLRAATILASIGRCRCAPTATNWASSSTTAMPKTPAPTSCSSWRRGGKRGLSPAHRSSISSQSIRTICPPFCRQRRSLAHRACGLLPRQLRVDSARRGLGADRPDGAGQRPR